MKAFALISGGLDSILAARLLNEQGIDVVALHFSIPFCSKAHFTSSENLDAAKRSCDDLGVGLNVIPIADDFLKILKNPSHGFGSQSNPCIDCKILMLRKAKEMMVQEGVSFIATGEVVGQRPMSQYKGALFRIEKKAGLEGLVVRPLSGKILPPTIPEKQGWIQREKLLDINGRGRKKQIALAKAFNLSAYNTPAGGCLLTDPSFSKKVKDLLHKKELDLDNVELLKVGRHFRVSGHAKFVVGRDEKESVRLLSLARDGDYLFLPPDDVAGATALGRGLFDRDSLLLSCKILSRYFDLNGRSNARVVYRRLPEQEVSEAQVEIVTDNQLAPYRI